MGMAEKLRLLLLDANVLLELHRLGLWSRACERCEFLIVRTVVEEAMFYFDDSGQKVFIELDESAGTFRAVETDLPTISAFRGRFTKLFLERMDVGEQEALAYLVEKNRDCMISSADAVAWRTLGLLGLRDQGVSLEEVLGRIGLSGNLEWQFTRAFREKWMAEGFREGLHGGSLRNPS